MKDLLVLTPDKNTKGAIEALLGRHGMLGIRTVTSDTYAHNKRDPGVLRQAHEFCRVFLNSHRYALVFFDHEGCGSQKSTAALSSEVQERLNQNGWRGRSSVFVFDPEVEVWVWADSPRVANALNWRSQTALNKWLEDEGFRAGGQLKPMRPKEAMEGALRKTRLPRSTSIYVQIARGVDFRSCQDESFMRLRATLQEWFPPKD